MGIFDYFWWVICVNVNSLIFNVEDLEKILEQIIKNMQNDLVKL